MKARRAGEQSGDPYVLMLWLWAKDEDLETLVGNHRNWSGCGRALGRGGFLETLATVETDLVVSEILGLKQFMIASETGLVMAKHSREGMVQMQIRNIKLKYNL